MNDEQISENTEHRAGRLHDGLCADDERRCGEYRHGSRMREGHLRQSGVDGELCGSHSAQRRHSRAGNGVLDAVSRGDSAEADGFGIEYGTG